MHEHRNPRTGAIDQCEVVEARHVEDSIGYLCEKTAKQECDDCGAAMCDLHAELCPLQQSGRGPTFCAWRQQPKIANGMAITIRDMFGPEVNFAETRK